MIPSTRVSPRPVPICCLLALVLAAPAGPAMAQAQTGQPLATPAPSTPPGFIDASLRDLFEDALRDFSRLPSTETATLLSFGGIAAGVGWRFDGHISRSVSGSSTLDRALAAGNTLGGARLQIASALATYTVGRLSKHGTLTTVGADLLRAQLLSQVMTLGIKTAVRRTRPDGTQYSFPSGHSSVTFSTATVLQRHFGWKAGIPAYSAAAYVAASRIQDKRHFLSDVAFGAAVGIAAGRTVMLGRGEKRFELSPAIAPGGGGISFRYVPAH